MWQDNIIFRWTIEGEEYFELSLKEYLSKNKADILIGISFAERKWDWENPEIIKR